MPLLKTKVPFFNLKLKVPFQIFAPLPLFRSVINGRRRYKNGNNSRVSEIVVWRNLFRS